MSLRRLITTARTGLLGLVILGGCGLTTAAQAPKWIHVESRAILYAPTVASDGSSYIVTDDSLLRGISPAGALMWAVDPAGRPAAAPALQGQVLYFPTSQRQLAAYSVAGNMAWRLTLDDQATATPAVAGNGTLYIGTLSGTLYAVNPGGGIVWSYPTGAPISTSPAVDSQGHVYVTNTYYQYAFTPSGQPMWIRPVPAPPATPMALDRGGADGDNLYFVDLAGSPWSVSPRGVKRWTGTASLTGNIIAASPVLSGDTLGSVFLNVTATVPPTTFTISGTVTLSGTSTGLSGATITATGGTTATTDSSGAYTLSNMANGNYTLTPTLLGYKFSPATIQVTVAGQNQTGQNFTAAQGAAALPEATAETTTTTYQVGAYDRDTGNAGWSQDYGGWGAPAVGADGVLYVPSVADNKVYLLDASTGDAVSYGSIDLQGNPGDAVLADTTAGSRLYFTVGTQLLCYGTTAGPDGTSPWAQLGGGPRHLYRRDDPPAVSFTSPADGDDVTGSVALATDVTDDFPGSLSVRFYVDDVLIDTVSAPPFEAVWYSQTYPDGDHTLTAEAKDSAGNMTRTSIVVTSQNAPGSFLVYADTPPVPFSWPGDDPESKYRVDFSSTEGDFTTTLATSKTPDRPWLKVTTWRPGGKVWDKVLRSASGNDGAETPVYWRVAGKSTSGDVAGGSFQISRVITCVTQSPADGDPVSSTQAPAFAWDGSHNKDFRVEVSDSSDFSTGVKLSSKTSSQPWLHKTSWTPGTAKWKKAAANASTLHWRVVARDSLGRTTTSPSSSMTVAQ